MKTREHNYVEPCDNFHSRTKPMSVHDLSRSVTVFRERRSTIDWMLFGRQSDAFCWGHELLHCDSESLGETTKQVPDCVTMSRIDL